MSEGPTTGEVARRDCEVLVVGAGPTGLLAAALLARSGVTVRIVEKRAEATRESRAFAVQARTLELMQSLGLADRFVAEGTRADAVCLHVHGRFRGGPDFTRAGAVDTPFPYILLIPQSRTEAILGDECARLGIAVERGVEVVGIAQDGDGVTAQLRGAGGATETVRAAYAIGGDGSHSIVRKQAGLAWHGDVLPQSFLLADCRVDWPLDHAHFRVFMNGPLVGLFLPIDGKRLSRVMATDTSASAQGGDATGAAPLDLTEMQRGLAAALALPVTLSDPVWVTRYRAHHRFVDHYRAGRTFVAGDAAHIHSPAGGQGMNTGLQDVANLAWKLAAVLRHGASDALLDSYDTERRPVGEEVVRSTGKLFAAAAGQSGFASRVRDAAVSLLLPLISRLPPFHRKAFFNISERAIAYPPSAFVAGEGGRVGPGARLPDAPLAQGSLFEAVAGYRFHLLVASRVPLTPQDVAALDLARAAGLAVVVVADETAPGALFDRLGVPAGGAATLLVRPDTYVAWRADGVAVDAARDFADRLGVRPDASGRVHDLAA